MALSLTSGIALWMGRLAGGEGRLPTWVLDEAFRRTVPKMGMAVDCSPPATAAVRAARLGPGLVTDLRLVTRWVVLRGPARREWEFVRAWDCRPGTPEEEELERGGRWCINGREDGCISWRGRRSHQHNWASQEREEASKTSPKTTGHTFEEAIANDLECSGCETTEGERDGHEDCGSRRVLSTGW
ncbi:hypothetical protein G6O67_003171 [Ophiocordyceps sinensis]|uniref:Uncharacterized protein n=1 Tax=Ophiocordyceps sinensis TaxID=72228 RepID=A0A8H4PVX4_9HYPO|nr:hypothetical protein G6O67_003171 [Ophiocordyceps sinensis]